MEQAELLPGIRQGVIQRAILKHDPNLVILTEANLSNKNLANVESEFDGYDIHHKVIPGTSQARVALLVKKSTLHLKCLKDLEHPDLACVWFKMRLDDQTVVLAACYRQWRLPIKIRNQRTGGVDGEVERFKTFQTQVKKAKQISRNLMLLGDISIDILETRDQVDCSNISRTMPIYKEILYDTGLSVLNKKPTRFRGK